MKPSELGTKYDKIAKWWHDQHVESSYGVEQFLKAIVFAPDGGVALDVGCGAGGRFVRILEEHDFSIIGVDVSKGMINLAKQNHPNQSFLHQDICSWETDERFDFIVAWDSIFHLPLNMQKPVVSKLSKLLKSNGVLIYTFGNGEGEHTDEWYEDTFYYSSMGINENIRILIDNGLTILHMELDQYPEKHVYVIATKP